MTHLADTLGLMPTVGIQGDTSLFLQRSITDVTGHAGLLLARAYAITDHKKLVLVILGILGGFSALVPVLVCAHLCISMDMRNGHRY
jgi:hypothetical protein